MAESLVVLAQAFRAALISFQPEMNSGEDCAAVVEELALVEKLSAVARVEAALRVKDCGAHEERGFAEVSDWMARVTGSTAGSAKAALQTVEALGSQPEVKAALDAGELSFAQARELVKTEAAVPGSTADLLEVAKTESFRTLREQARDRRVRAIDPVELHARQHAAMSHRTWINALGNVAYAGELPPELGIPFMNVLDAEADRLWLKAHQEAKRQAGAIPLDRVDTSNGTGAHVALGNVGADGKVELRRSALAAQAFARMVENGGGKGKTNRADLVIVCDLRAWRRGHAHEDEPCHIIGGGPIPVSLAKELGCDAFVAHLLRQ